MRERIFKADALVVAGLFIAAALSLHAGCRKQVEGPEGVASARIDGVALGDTRERVEALLGEPDLGGVADGLYRSWFQFSYLKGPHAGLTVLLLDEGQGFGPVDVLEVAIPYDGRTKEGIGLGSTVEEVHAAYGLPRVTQPLREGRTMDLYCFGDKELEIHSGDGRVETIATKYFKPLPKEAGSPCEGS